MANKVHVKKDDTVLVLSGKDRGKKGKVLSVNPSTNQVLVEGVNMSTKHKSLEEDISRVVLSIRSHTLTVQMSCWFVTNAVSLPRLQRQFLKMVKRLELVRTVTKSLT